MGPDSTSDAFVVKFLNNVVIGAQPPLGPVRQLVRVRVPGPDEVPPDMSPAKEVDQAVCLLASEYLRLN